jgi:hypothetical protein
MRTSINKKKRTSLSTVSSATLIAVMPLLASCASSGFYYMSDDWCRTHLDAGPARCPENQKARVSGVKPAIDAQRSGFASR